MNTTHSHRISKPPSNAIRTGRWQGFAAGLILGALGKHAVALLPFACGTLEVQHVKWESRQPAVLPTIVTATPPPPPAK